MERGNNLGHVCWKSKKGPAKKKKKQRELAVERDARPQALSEQERSAVVLPAAKIRLAKRWTLHKATHFPSKPWCKYCPTLKGRQVRHRSYLPQDRDREGSLIQMECVFLKATGEQAELQKEAWSTAVTWVRVGAGLSCLTSAQNKGAVGAPANNLPAFPSGYMMQVVQSFLKRLCSDVRDCIDRRRNNDTRIG